MGAANSDGFWNTWNSICTYFKVEKIHSKMHMKALFAFNCNYFYHTQIHFCPIVPCLFSNAHNHNIFVFNPFPPAGLLRLALMNRAILRLVWIHSTMIKVKRLIRPCWLSITSIENLFACISPIQTLVDSIVPIHVLFGAVKFWLNFINYHPKKSERKQ